MTTLKGQFIPNVKNNAFLTHPWLNLGKQIVLVLFVQALRFLFPAQHNGDEWHQHWKVTHVTFYTWNKLNWDSWFWLHALQYLLKSLGFKSANSFTILLLWIIQELFLCSSKENCSQSGLRIIQSNGNTVSEKQQCEFLEYHFSIIFFPKHRINLPPLF